MTLTDEQRAQIEKKEEYIKQKEYFLKERKALLQDLEYAENDMEEAWIEERRNALAVKIKALAHTLREIEAWEADA